MTNMSAFKASIEAMNSEIEVIRKKLSVTIKESFENAIQDSLNTFLPQVDQLYWNQYTPYFNDGDECTFGVNDPNIIVKGGDDYTDSCTLRYYASAPEISYYQYLRNDGITPEDAIRIADQLDEFHSLLLTIGNDGMKDAFGDHARVTAKYDESKSRWVISTDHYDHE